MFEYVNLKFRMAATLLLVPVLMTCLILSGSANASGVEFSAGTGAGFYWWDDNGGSSGQQVLVPVEVRASAQDYSFRVLSGYAYTSYDGNGIDSRYMADILDTKVNLTFRHALPCSLNLLAGLDLNLPTGRTGLRLDDVTLMMDPDLVPVVTFGEGFNVNPIALLMRTWGKTDVALGFSYVFRGEYDYAETVTDYNPGDIQRYVFKVRFRQPAHASFYLGGVYTNYGTDKLAGENLYRPGSMWNLSGGCECRLGSWVVDTGINYFLRGEDRYRVPGSFSLQTEEHVGYGDEAFVHSDVRYRLSALTVFNFGLGFLWIGENDYPETSTYYSGERRKLSMTVGADQRLWKNWTLSGSLCGFTMHDGRTSSHPNNERSYRGVGVTVNLKAGF